MNRTVFTPLLLFLLLAAGTAWAETTPCWVLFADRGSVDISRKVAAKAASSEEPKNQSRRARVLGSAIFDERDLPVNPEYVSAVAEIAGSIRTVTRYFNGVSVDLDENGIEKVKSLPFVKDVQSVMRLKHSPDPAPKTALPEGAREKPADISYGNSYYQLNTVGAIKLQNLGYFGDGIRIGILDSGFNYLDHPAFDSLRVVKTWDFVGHDEDVSGDNHGSKVLSVMAAIDRGHLMGVAPHATYLLARTEIVENINVGDYRVEEDYWVAGLEWADSLGADVVQSSLGYTDFVDGTSYTYYDLNGQTAKTSIAADIAVEKGVVVVNSAGNEGDTAWYYVVTPADGKRVIAVGSVYLDNNLKPVISSFSSRGPTSDNRIKPDFVALGEDVVMINPGTTGYGTSQGTSYSSPAVSGAAALLLQVHPEWSPAVLYDSLKVYAQSAGADSLAGWGLIDAFKTSGLSQSGSDIAGFTAYSPYPQPVQFSKSSARLYFPVDVPAAGLLTLKIYNFAGENVKTIEEEIAAAGSYRDRTGAPNWDGANFTGDTVASGIYYYSMKLTGYGEHKGKIAVIR